MSTPTTQMQLVQKIWKSFVRQVRSTSHRFRLWKWYIAAARIRAPDNGGGGGKTVINHGGFGRRNRERRRDEKGGRLEKSERRRYITAAISLPPPLLSSAITRDGIVSLFDRREGARSRGLDEYIRSHTLFRVPANSPRNERG